MKLIADWEEVITYDSERMMQRIRVKVFIMALFLLESFSSIISI
jgi:hypothetical protein